MMIASISRVNAGRGFGQQGRAGRWRKGLKYAYRKRSRRRSLAVRPLPVYTAPAIIPALLFVRAKEGFVPLSDAIRAYRRAAVSESGFDRRY